MGEVYRARDPKLSREIALKILPADLAASPEALRRFEQEARAASALNHPGIVTIYDIGRSHAIVWIAMELVDGKDLRTLAAGDLSTKQILRIAVKAADALAAAHDRGIIHRDLKPDNVMVTQDGFVKLLDFGLAKQVRPLTANDTTVPHTTPGAVFGTVGYMSPEQAMGREMDSRSDQFSFGVMLYEMLTGVRPFDRASKPETMAAIIRDDVAPVSSIDPSLPSQLDRVLQRCLAKDPRERYASTRDMVHDLREARDSLTHPSQRSGRTSPPWPAATRRISRAAIVLAILALVTVGSVMMWNRARGRALQGIESLAVLPFHDGSRSADGRILADGIADRIASRLAEVREIRVAPPFGGAPLGENDDARAVATRTNTTAVLRGAVTREGNDLAVEYTLADGRNGKPLISGTARRKWPDVFGIEEDVVGDILASLGRQGPVVRGSAGGTLAPEDQHRLVEAVGLLQRVRSEESVDRAAAMLESILRNSRQSGTVNALLARALLYKASLSRRPALVEQATVYATRAVSLAPQDAEAHITLGQLHNASGRYSDALVSFQRALGLRPESSEVAAGMADAYEGLGRTADAERMYRRAITLRSDAAGTYMKYGAFCYTRGRYEDAAGHFRKATDLMPDFPAAWSNLGAALQALGRNDEAVVSYRKAIDITPTAPALSNLGTLQFYLGQYDEAEKSFQRASTIAPSDFQMWANLGDAQRWSGSGKARSIATYRRAVELGREALRVNPRDAMTRATIALCLAKSGDLPSAGKEMSAALEADPTNAVVLYNAAVVAALEGKRDTALAWLEKAIAAGYPAADARHDPELLDIAAALKTEKGGNT